MISLCLGQFKKKIAVPQVYQNELLVTLFICSPAMGKYSILLQLPVALHDDHLPISRFASQHQVCLINLLDDIALVSASHLPAIKLTLELPELTLFRGMLPLCWHGSSSVLCALSALMQCLPLQGRSPGPLCLLSSGQPSLMLCCHVDLKTFSLLLVYRVPFQVRIGAAIVAARSGIPDHLLQPMLAVLWSSCGGSCTGSLLAVTMTVTFGQVSLSALQ